MGVFLSFNYNNLVNSTNDNLDCCERTIKIEEGVHRLDEKITLKFEDVDGRLDDFYIWVGVIGGIVILLFGFNVYNTKDVAKAQAIVGLKELDDNIKNMEKQMQEVSRQITEYDETLAERTEKDKIANKLKRIKDENT